MPGIDIETLRVTGVLNELAAKSANGFVSLRNLRDKPWMERRARVCIVYDRAADDIVRDFNHDGGATYYTQSNPGMRFRVHPLSGTPDEVHVLLEARDGETNVAVIRDGLWHVETWRHGWNQKGAVTSHDSFALRAPGVTQPSWVS